MNRLILTSLVVLSACKISASGSEPDPHLGTLVEEFGEVNADPSAGSMKFLNGLFTPDKNGTVHIVGTLGPSREFGTANIHFNKSAYWKVTADGKIEKKAGPAYSASTTTNNGLLLRMGADDQQPVLVQYTGAGLGRLLAFYWYTGSEWKERSFFLSERPQGVEKATFGGEDQVRPMGNGEFVIQFGGRLMRSTETGWTELPRPLKAVDMRLVNADATRLRVVWLEPGNRLVAGTYTRADWSLSPTVKSQRLTFEAKDFGTTYSTSGTVDAFVIDVGMSTYRFAANSFTQTGSGSGGQAITSLSLGYDARRAMRGFNAVFLGRDTGLPLTERMPGVNPVNCPVPDAGPPPSQEGNLTMRELTNPFPDGLQARTCLPHKVDTQMAPLPDLSAFILLTVDRTQDAVSRMYVKKVPIPVPADPFYGAPLPTTSMFPGDDGSDDTAATNQPTISGHAFIVGAQDQSALQVTLVPLLHPERTELVTVDTDGSFRSAAEPADTYTLTVTAMTGNFEPQLREVTTNGTTAVDIGSIVLTSTDQQAEPAPYKPGSQLLGFTSGFNTYMLSGTTLTHGTPRFAFQGDPQFDIVSTAVGATPTPIFYGRRTDSLVGWQEGAVTKLKTDVNSFSFTGVSLHDYRLAGAGLPPVLASGPVDGVTPRDWKWSTDTVFLAGAVDMQLSIYNEISCQAVAYWGAGDGGITGYWMNGCSPSSFSQPMTGTVPAPPLTFLPPAMEVNVYQGSGCGQEGGLTRVCPLFSIAGGDSLKLGDQVIEYQTGLYPKILERTGSTAKLGTYTVNTRQLTPLVTDLEVPTSYANDAHALYALGNGGTLVRAPGGFTFVSPNGVKTPVNANAVRTWNVNTDVLMLVAPSGSTACAGECTLERIVGAGLVSMRQTLGEHLTGDEPVIYPGGNMSSLILKQRQWDECPGGPCPVVVRTDESLAEHVLTRGTVVQLPKTFTYAPALFLKFNEDGGTPIPMMYR